MDNEKIKLKTKNKRRYIILALVVGIFISPIAYVAIREFYRHQVWTKKIANSHLVVVGVDTSKVKILLGEPDIRNSNRWTYYEKEIFGIGEVFEIKFKEGVVCSTEKYMF